MYRNLWGLLGAFVASLGIALLVFGASSARHEPPADFTFVNGTEPKSLDPNIMTGQPEGRIGDAIFEGLTYRDPVSLQPTPGMAESWEISEDGRTYTFRMRPGVRWSDGTPLTAHDFAWSWRRLQDPYLGSEYPYIQHMIRYAEEFNTYGGQVSRLLGSAAGALVELAQRRPDGVDRDTWKAYVAEKRLDEARWLDLAPLAAQARVVPADVYPLVQACAREAGSRLGALVEEAVAAGPRTAEAMAGWSEEERKAEEARQATLAWVLGGTSRALLTLIRNHPDGVEAVGSSPSWAAYLKGQHVNDTLKGTPDASLREALVRTSGRFTRAELRALLAAMIGEAGRRAAVWAEAHARYGKSGGVFAEDDRTLVVELRAPTPYFLEITSFYSSYPVPRHVVLKQDADGNLLEGEYVDDWFTPGKIVSNGPFVLTDWRVNEKIRIRKNPEYWNKDGIRLEIVDALPIENATTGMNLYLSGTVDWMPVPPPDLAGVLKGRPENDYYLRPGMIVYYYRINCTRKGLDDPRVRRAIAMAIDRDSIVTNILKQGQVPAYRVVPPGIPGYEPPPSGLSFDPEAARALLAEAGYPGGKGLPTLRLLFNTSESHKAIAEAITDQLKTHLGLEVTAYNQEWQAYQANMLALDYDIARAGWIGDYLDPNTFLDMWVTNGGNNQTGWSNARFDELIRYAADVELLVQGDAEPFLATLKEPEKARALLAAMTAASDTPSRLAAGERLRFHLFREAEALMFQDEVPIIPIYYYVTSSLVHPYVKGWHADLTLPDGTTVPNLQDIHPLRGISIDREQQQRMFPR